MNNESFLGLLAESPFAGLQEHMSVGDDAVSKLGDFVVAISEEDWRTAEECREEIVDWKIVRTTSKIISVIIFQNHSS